MKNNKIQLFASAMILFSPFISFGQGGPGGPPNEGAGSDGSAVPFDDNMNLLFLAASIAFAVMITIKQLRKKQQAA
jgi:hypothetical protein